MLKGPARLTIVGFVGLVTGQPTAATVTTRSPAEGTTMTNTSFEAAIAALATAPAPPSSDQMSNSDDVRHQFVKLLGELSPTIEFDPIVHIQSGCQVGAEALARFAGDGTPAEWFRCAHAVGAGVDLELRVLQAVTAQLDGRVGFVGANLSPRALVDPRTPATLDGLGGAELVIEVTDQTVLPKWSVLSAGIDGIRDRGARIAMHVTQFDHEVLGAMMQLQPDVIKLGPELTAAIAAGRAASTAADNVFRYCRREGVFLVAVGVEHHDQIGPLRDRGVDATQGQVHTTSTVEVPRFDLDER